MNREMIGAMDINISHDLSRRILMRKRDILRRYDNDMMILANREIRPLGRRLEI